MKLVLICATLFVVPLSAANASFRPQPSRLPAPSSSAPSEIGRGGWDTRTQDKWDRGLRHCLNDRR
ncbi:MAG: hypothetical protein J0J06_08770 [Sphingomonas sp.]|uniref:hypothetical protein n=1 Tax=Sphingomonas sp. TaxID=28214 RepID=UPI001ACA317C|nr:hypothetical protein [Sphingomonas sp.]MBN8815523.1 hypothetical protein [Sphingomonas sp.]